MQLEGLFAGFMMLLSGGCESPSTMDGHAKVEQSVQQLRCRLCYDETRKVLKFVSKAPKSKGHRIYKKIKEHRCEECKIPVEFYEQDGVPMIRCERCAPEGLPCDLCRPPSTP